MVLAEGHSRALSTDRVLQSMEQICRSHIQKHMAMTARFTNILRGSTNDVVPQKGGVPPTLENIARLTAETSAAATVGRRQPQQYNPAARAQLPSGAVVTPFATSTPMPPPCVSAATASTHPGPVSSDAKLSDESAHKLYETIGVSPVRSEGKAATARLNGFLQSQLRMSAEDAERVYKFSKSGTQHLCQVFLQGEELGSHSDLEESVAKEVAAKKTLHSMLRHQRYMKQFLIEIPSDGTTSTLLRQTLSFV